jgi:predicted nucleic acid-binding protein
MDLLADTVFLIDLWREGGGSGPASNYARAHSGKQVAISWVVAGEFLSGAAAAGLDLALVTAFLARYPVIQSDAAVIRQYADAYAGLRQKNELIGPNDLWIAATALAHELPILTRNSKEFMRIEDLGVIDYVTAA